MEAFLSNPVKPNLDDIAGQGAAYAKSFVEAARQKNVPLGEELRSEISGVLMTFFPALQAAGAEFGYRTAHEICRFVYFHKELSGGDWSFDAAMDAAVMQKLLPKLHGSKKKLGPVLAALIRLCLKPEARPENDPVADEVLVEENAKYPAALEKLKRMRQRLAEHGFTSFAEA
jgi:5-methylcytosine-specific restriction protein B